MAKKKTENIETENNNEIYSVNPQILKIGYLADIEGGLCAVIPYNDKIFLNTATKRFEPKKPETYHLIPENYKLGTVVLNNEFTGKNYFENLTHSQIKTLSNAGVIKLTKEQSKKYWPEESD